MAPPRPRHHRLYVKLSFVVLLIILVSAVVVVARGFGLQRESQQLANQYRQEKKTGFDAVVDSSFDLTKAFARDYTIWDDMVLATKTRDQAWFDQNVATALTTYQASAVWVLDNHYQQVYSAYAEEAGKRPAFPIDLGKQANNFFSQGYFVDFFTTSNGEIFKVFVAPTQPSDDTARKTPPQGYFFVAKRLDQAYVNQIEKASGTKVEVKDGPGQTVDDQVGNGIVGFTSPLHDWSGREVAHFNVQAQSPYLKAQNQINFTQFFILIVTITTSVLVILALYFMVSAPLKKISGAIAWGDASRLGRILRRRDELGDIARLVQVNLDQTKELQQAKAHVDHMVNHRTAQLHQEHARLRATIDSLPVGLVILDEELQEQGCNRLAQTLINPQETAAQDSQACPYLFEELDIRTQVEASLHHKIAVSLREINYHDKVLRIHIAPILIKHQTAATGIVVILEDITEEKVMQRSKEEFLSIASHELRTPLTAIRGNATLLAKTYGDSLHDDNFNELIGDIEFSSERLLGIVNDYLETSSLEQGKLSIVTQDFAIAPLVERVLRELTPLAQQKRLYLKLAKSRGDLPLVAADPQRVSQVLINLISNGLNYSTHGGVTVNIKVEGSDFINILVSDTGSGISEENKKLLFRKFQQASSNILTRDWKRSTGLGLYIAKLLVEKMGGQIQLVASRPNQGSTFAFTLPQARPDVAVTSHND